MRRRDLLALAGGAAAWPLLARAQQPGKLPTIAVLMVVAETDPEALARVQAFRDGLAALGWVDGKTARLEVRWAAGDSRRLDAYAKDLVAMKPEVFLANGTPTVLALKKLTTSIPVVFALAIDPVGVGLIQSLARPGGNITGFTFINAEIIGKWRELLVDVAPSVTRAALLFNPKVNPWYFGFVHDLEHAPQPVGRIDPKPVTTLGEIQSAVADEQRPPGGSVIIGPDGFVVGHLAEIAALAAKNRLPSMSVYRKFADAGGLMSYGPNVPDIFRRAAAYVDRILKGANPADLPVQQPTKFDFVVNVRTATTLGLTVPLSLLTTADQVIE